MKIRKSFCGCDYANSDRERVIQRDNQICRRDTGFKQEACNLGERMNSGVGSS